MNNNQPNGKKISLKDRILARIQDHDVEMHSRSYFLLRVIVLAVVAFLSLVVSIWICNFLFFFIRINEYPHLHRGPAGILAFLAFFPWLLLIIDIILIAVAERLLRQFSFGYRRPVIYVLFALLAFTIALGLFIDRVTEFNESMTEHAHHGDLPPPLGEIYEHAHRLEITY